MQQLTNLAVAISLMAFISCDQKEPDLVSPNPKINFKFKFDPDQERLGNFGQVESIPTTNAAQSPIFHLMGAHYLELSDNQNVAAYDGVELFKSPLTNEGGLEAIDFDQAIFGADGEVFFTADLKSIPIGSYKYLRMSLLYQNYSVAFSVGNLDLTGTIASFVGTNTYIDSYTIKDQDVTVNANKLQGYWGFETNLPNIEITEGQVPPGSTTVPNPISSSSPIPPGSCLVTGEFERALDITGEETSDITIICSISINNSFEWKDGNQNGTFEPLEGDEVVNMGVRGLIPLIEQ